MKYSSVLFITLIFTTENTRQFNNSDLERIHGGNKGKENSLKTAFINNLHEHFSDQNNNLKLLIFLEDKLNKTKNYYVISEDEDKLEEVKLEDKYFKATKRVVKINELDLEKVVVLQTFGTTCLNSKYYILKNIKRSEKVIPEIQEAKNLSNVFFVCAIINVTLFGIKIAQSIFKLNNFFNKNRLESWDTHSEGMLQL